MAAEGIVMCNHGQSSVPDAELSLALFAVRHGRVVTLNITMSEPKWTNEETFKFIELYQNEPTIWNPKNQYHKDKYMVSDAWQRISEAMSVPVTELKKKKETLLAAFRLNHKKVQASIRSGAEEEDIFKPIWVYYDALAAFLSDMYECKTVTTTEDEREVSPSIYEADRDQVEYKSGRPAQVPAQKRHCCGQTPAIADTLAQVNTALTTLNKSIDNVKQIEDDDECALYGKLLAYKLKPFSSMERHALMYEIDGLILKRQRIW